MERTGKNFQAKTNKDKYNLHGIYYSKNMEEHEESDEDCNCNETDDENNCGCGCLNEKENVPEKEKTTMDYVEQVGWFIGKTALITGISMVGMSLLPSVLGFTSGGIAARSLAAAYQSRFLGGTIVKGSMFSIMQRVGVKGFATSTKALVGAGSMLYSAATTSSNKKENESSSSPNLRNNRKKCTCKRSQMKNKKFI